MIKLSSALLGLFCSILLVGASTARAQTVDPPWPVRLRALNLTSANRDSSGLGLGIANEVLPDLNVMYFWTPELLTL